MKDIIMFRILVCVCFVIVLNELTCVCEIKSILIIEPMNEDISFMIILRS